MLAILLLAAALQAPDTAYFQQRVDYRIEARLDERAQQLEGRLRLDYRNRSARQLDTLWFHLHLNAFRPGSRYAAAEERSGTPRFARLGPEQHGYERVHAARVGSRTVTPIFPLAPDSTVMGIALPTPLLPGDSVRVAFEWTARTSALPRRQGRSGRHWDFAHWYPRIAVFDRDGWQVQPLLPQGEFYGEFASYDVTLDLAADQVMAATGVPVEGDPGWEAAAATPGTRPEYRREAYAPRPVEPLGLLPARAENGRRRVRWRAEDVHHFAWTTNPEYIYENGRYGDVAVHVLYRPGDTAWAGTAARRTEAALAWYDSIFGAFAWPQLSNVHRIEGGGTEFPMMMMNGSPSFGLILHETGHNYVQGILANNEFREGWLDEGFVSFLTEWALYRRGVEAPWRGAIETVRRLEDARPVQPVAWPGAEYVDPTLYGVMTYAKANAIFWMLHDVMGEAALRAGLRSYYDRHRLQHVREQDLRAAMQEHHPGGLDWFFHQWLHTTGRLDYALGSVESRRRRDGRWELSVEVLRHGEIWMPVTLEVDGERHRLTSPARRQVLTFIRERAAEHVRIDPDGVLLESDVANNQWPAPADPGR